MCVRSVNKSAGNFIAFPGLGTWTSKGHVFVDQVCGGPCGDTKGSIKEGFMEEVVLVLTLDSIQVTEDVYERVGGGSPG